MEEALFWLNKAAKNPKLDPESLATAAGIIGFLHLDGGAGHSRGSSSLSTPCVAWYRYG